MYLTKPRFSTVYVRLGHTPGAAALSRTTEGVQRASYREEQRVAGGRVHVSGTGVLPRSVTSYHGY